MFALALIRPRIAASKSCSPRALPFMLSFTPYSHTTLSLTHTITTSMYCPNDHRHQTFEKDLLQPSWRTKKLSFKYCTTQDRCERTLTWSTSPRIHHSPRSSLLLNRCERTTLGAGGLRNCHNKESKHCAPCNPGVFEGDQRSAAAMGDKECKNWCYAEKVRTHAHARVTVYAFNHKRS